MTGGDSLDAAHGDVGLGTDMSPETRPALMTSVDPRVEIVRCSESPGDRVLQWVTALGSRVVLCGSRLRLHPADWAERARL